MPKVSSEMRRLAGLDGYDPWKLRTEDDDSHDAPGSPRPPKDSDDPEMDQDAPVTPAPDGEEPEATGAGALQHWDMYRKLEAKALGLARENIAMHECMKEMTESGMEPEQRRALKGARQAVESAIRAQKEAYRKISEFGSTVLGR